MWQKFLAWYASHTITSHSVAVVIGGLTLFYSTIPAFKTLVDTLYARSGPTFHLYAAAAIGIAGWYTMRAKAPPPTGAQLVKAQRIAQAQAALDAAKKMPLP
jgi:hypothetical protein